VVEVQPFISARISLTSFRNGSGAFETSSAFTRASQPGSALAWATIAFAE
jgi:hypothetical protein